MVSFGASHANVDIDRNDDQFVLDFSFQCPSIKPNRLSNLKKTLAVKRNPELEDYYWQLTGETESSNELELVAMMSDQSVVEYIDGVLRIKLVRKI